MKGKKILKEKRDLKTTKKKREVLKEGRRKKIGELPASFSGRKRAIKTKKGEAWGGAGGRAHRHLKITGKIWKTKSGVPKWAKREKRSWCIENGWHRGNSILGFLGSLIETGQR